MTNPYRGLPDRQFWRRGVAGVEPFMLDPVVDPRFSIVPTDRVATAGSCFAQHIARRLDENGFNYFVTEDGADLAEVDREGENYGVFSARYGNIYTARQLLQLAQEVFEGRQAQDTAWLRSDGRYVDPLRPQISQRAFETPEQVRLARAEHLEAVRRMFLECDVFVFTLGLTEGWRAISDGTVFPVAPGVSGGDFDAERYEFINFGVADVLADMRSFLTLLRGVNADVRVVLTVSPVPLIATYEPRNALVATTYSKSVLRVVADELWRQHDFVDYFPSYEVITGNFNGGRYYEADLREVNGIGVDHAMRCFLRNYTDATARTDQAWTHVNAASADVVCDEEAIEQVGV